MENNKTIIYYSANVENSEFEQKIIDNIKNQARDIPIISVTRKPINMGKNICIGEKPVCYSNSFKQILIGLKEAKTEFCIAAESDVLYPPEYFTFTPPVKDKVYRYTNLYVHFDGRDKFWKKNWVEGAQMCGREHWIKCIEKILENPNSWEPETFKFIFDEKNEYGWEGKNPVLYFKTREGIGFKTGYNQKIVTRELPYWGTAEEVKKLYLK
ncbi:MAG: hypothetical protein WC917_01700 [Bacilli bacterium]|jgi:hypothetical protein